MSKVFYKKSFAYDLSVDLIDEGDIFDEDVINQSIMSILSTSPGERIFNLEFGSALPSLLFESFTEEFSEEILDTLLLSIIEWEDRITLLQDEIEMEVIDSQNAITLMIPYIVNKSKIKSFFYRKIIF